MAQLAKPLKSLGLIKLGIIFAGLSFVFFVFGGRSNVALGGLLGEMIAYLTSDWQNVHKILNNGKFFLRIFYLFDIIYLPRFYGFPYFMLHIK